MSLSDGPFTAIDIIGGGGGVGFTSVGWVQGVAALVITVLDVWYNDNRLRGMQFTYSDNNQTIVYGEAEESYASIVFQPGELVESLTLWLGGGNGIGTRAGRIRLTTNKGQTLDVGNDDTDGQTAYDIDVGSGILVGMVGNSGADVDSVGAVFLDSPVKTINISNIVYDPDLVNTTAGISQVALQEQRYSNPGNSSSVLTWNFSGSDTRATSTSYSQTSGNSFGASISVEVSAEFLGLGVKATGETQWESMSEQTTTTSVMDSITLSWSLSGQLKSGESITCNAIVQRGDGSAAYDSTVTVILEDGTTNTFQESGQFQTVTYSAVTIQTS